jgi:L-lactate dehydrogenase complex protein LldG
MTERDKIFARIREALRVPAPRPGSHHAFAHESSQTGRPVEQARQWLPPGGNTFEEQLQRFQAASAELKADFQLLDDREHVATALVKLRDAEGWKAVASHDGALTDFALAALRLPVVRTDLPYDLAELERCDAGLTECDALVAQTGGVLLTSRGAGGRALSVLPPHHVVLARREQLLPDLAAALALVKQRYAPGYPSMISFITGPSRTGDIERILVLGAHGPKKLTILCF